MKPLNINIWNSFKVDLIFTNGMEYKKQSSQHCDLTIHQNISSSLHLEAKSYHTGALAIFPWRHLARGTMNQHKSGPLGRTYCLNWAQKRQFQFPGKDIIPGCQKFSFYFGIFSLSKLQNVKNAPYRSIYHYILITLHWVF